MSSFNSSNEAMNTRARNVVPLGMFILSLCVFAFLLGMTTAHLKVFPYYQVRSAWRTLNALVETWRTGEEGYIGEHIEATEYLPGEAERHRWTILDATVPRLPVIAYGGMNQYLKQCPDQGCVAVAFGRDGTIVESWPYRPGNIYSADITQGAYEREAIEFDPDFHTRPIGVTRYRNGDVLVTFQAMGSVFPFSAGVARIGQDGSPRWMRFDFSHHWSTLTANEIALVPAL